jgi:hypothetical protein
MNIVLAGSIQVSVLPQEVIEQLNYWMESECNFLIGDAPGADTAFQSYLLKVDYKLVTIFTSNDEVRNNSGGWASEIIDSGLKSNGHARHSAKDRHMTQLAEIGLMLWDGKSAGTLANIIDLLRQGKECFVYVLTEKSFSKFDTEDALVNAISNHKEAHTEAVKRLASYDKRIKNRLKEVIDDQQSLF